jgi:hypothetical protein
MLSLGGLTDVSLRARWMRHRRVLVPIVVAVLAVGAFLEWGPIGLGNGPLVMAMTGDGYGSTSSRQPVAIWTPFDNLGGSALVVDSVQLIGNSSYPAPQVLAMEEMSNPECGNLTPVRTIAAGFVIGGGCSDRPLGRLVGRAIGNTDSRPLWAAFELKPPRPGACWLMTRIVVRYHIGIRHYVSSDPYIEAACGRSRARADAIAADAAGG